MSKPLLKTPIRYYGGQQRSLKHILPLIPEHELYNEPFAGGASVFFAKERTLPASRSKKRIQEEWIITNY